MVEEGQLLWTPGREFADGSNIAAYMAWLRAERGLDFPDYEALRRWSVEDLEPFWQTIWDYFDLRSSTPPGRVLSSRTMPGARWFDGARVNYAEHVLRHETTGDPARTVLQHSSELRPHARLSWGELGRSVRLVATRLRGLGIKPGDRVVSYMPNIPETMIAMLATTAIGAVWSSAAPEFGAKTVIDRFAQIAPKLMFVVDGYRYGGKDFDRRPIAAEIIAAVPSLETIVTLNYLDADTSWPSLGPATVAWADLLAPGAGEPEAFEYERVASDHPLWILFSSGTTGLPKAIVHGHAGILLEHYKSAAFHINLKPSSVMFFYSTTGWMMWNTLPWALLMNGSSVLYDGHPAYPAPDMLWGLAAKTGVTCFGTSPTSIGSMQKLGLRPKAVHDLTKVENIFMAGSPATPEAFGWLYENVNPDFWVTTQSGGTEFCSGLLAAVPLLPVYAAEIQARALDEAGNALTGQTGELVVASPMPSMPLYLWGDADFKRYKESYFADYPGLWRHGDQLMINERGGCYVYGRSDATLNRFGVRIGSAEIYRTLDAMPEIADSLIVCIEEPGGGFYMPLFVALRDGKALDAATKAAIVQKLREERSPRHVPDEIIAAPGIPYTLSAKKMEVPVRKLLMGVPVEKAAAKDVTREPEIIAWYAEFAARRRAGKSA